MISHIIIRASFTLQERYIRAVERKPRGSVGREGASAERSPSFFGIPFSRKGLSPHRERKEGA